MRYLIVLNLAAGSAGRSIYDFERALIKSGDEVVLRTLDWDHPIESLLADAAEFDLIVIAGGDGTASSALYELRGIDVPILYYPAGTTNLLNINLENPTDPIPLAHRVEAGYMLSFDLGELELETLGQDEDGGTNRGARLASRPVRRFTGFDIIAGAGLDATIMEQAIGLKSLLGSAAYPAAALATPNPIKSHFTLTLDGKRVESDGICVLLVNFGKVADQLSVTPDNDPRDGIFDVVVIRAEHPVMLLPVIIASFLGLEGRFLERSDVAEIYKARSVRVEADPPLTIQFDGEPTGIYTPFSARVLPGAVKLIVGENTYLEAIKALPEG